MASTATARKKIQSVLGQLIRDRKVNCPTSEMAARVIARLDTEEIIAEGHEKIADDVRREIKRFKTANGLSIVENVESVDEDGNRVQIYKQLDLFTGPEFAARVDYYARVSKRSGTKANALAVYARTLGFQIPIPFPDLPTELNGTDEDEDGE